MMVRQLSMQEYVRLSAEVHDLARAGRHQEALAGCRTLIEGDDSPAARATAYCTRGVILWQDLHSADEAIADFSRAMELDRKSIHPLLWRAKCYAQSGHHDAAAADWREITQRDVGEELWFEACDALRRLGQLSLEEEELAKRRAEEVAAREDRKLKQLEAERARQTAEFEKRRSVQATRRSLGHCYLCGERLSIFQKLLRKGSNRRCWGYRE